LHYSDDVGQRFIGHFSSATSNPIRKERRSILPLGGQATIFGNGRALTGPTTKTTKKTITKQTND
jgi:hypothetical protein